MKELLELIFSFRLKDLFFTPTTNGMIQFFRYAFVGGVATIVDWGVQFIATEAGLHYLISAILAFILGLICNFALSKLFVFNAQEARVNPVAEFVSYGIIGVIGLGITVLIMYVLTDIFKIYFMFSKIIATLIVLFWNYFARKTFLYKK